MSDVVVQGRDRAVRAMHFTHGWQPAESTREAPIVRPQSGADYVDLLARTYRSATGAPFAIVDTSATGHPCPYDVATMTWDDLDVLFAQEWVVELELTGADLLTARGANPGKWWAIMPAPDAASIDTAATYRVATSPDIIWALGWYHQINPAGARVVGGPDVFTAAARQVWGVRRTGE